MQELVLQKLGIQARSAFNILSNKELCERIVNEDPIWLDDFAKEYSVSKSVLKRLIDKNIISCFSNMNTRGSKVFIFKEETLGVFKLNYNNTASLFLNINNMIEIYLLHVKDTITNREYEILYDTLMRNISYEEISKKYDLTRERVRQISERANRRIKNSYRINIEYEKLKSDYEQLKYEVKVLKEKRMFLSKLKILQKESTEFSPKYEALSKNISDLDMSFRLLNGLSNLNIETLRDVVVRDREYFLKARNFGVKSLRELEYILADKKLSFSMLVPDLR